MRLTRRGAVSVLAALAVLVLAEVGVRQISPSLVEPREWHSYEAQVKVHQMDALADRGGASIVFFGTSMTDAAVDPVRLTAALGPGATAYNAALSLGYPTITDRWSRAVVLPRLRPNTVVIGISSLDFLPESDVSTEQYRSVFEAPAMQRALGTASTTEEIEHAVESASELFRYRSALRDPIAVYHAIRGDEPELPEPEARTIRPLGFQAFSVDRRFEDRAAYGTAILQNALSHFAVERAATDVFRRVIETNRSAGREVVLVALPVTEEYIALHPRGRADFDGFKRVLGELASSTGAGLVDLTDLTDHRYFADENHLNGAGTTAVTDRLAIALRDRP